MTIKSFTNLDTFFVDTTVKNGHSYWYKISAVNELGKETYISNIAGVNIKTEPIIVINGGDKFTSSRAVSVTILANTAQQMIISNYENFQEAAWETYETNKNWNLLDFDGVKSV